MTMQKRDLASFDEAGSQWLVEAGTYTFAVGASSRDIRGRATANISQLTEPTSNALAPKQELKLMKQ